MSWGETLYGSPLNSTLPLKGCPRDGTPVTGGGAVIPVGRREAFNSKWLPLLLPLLLIPWGIACKSGILLDHPTPDWASPWSGFCPGISTLMFGLFNASGWAANPPILFKAGMFSPGFVMKGAMFIPAIGSPLIGREGLTVWSVAVGPAVIPFDGVFIWRLTGLLDLSLILWVSWDGTTPCPTLIPAWFINCCCWLIPVTELTGTLFAGWREGTTGDGTEDGGTETLEGSERPLLANSMTFCISFREDKSNLMTVSRMRPPSLLIAWRASSSEAKAMKASPFSPPTICTPPSGIFRPEKNFLMSTEFADQGRFWSRMMIDMIDWLPGTFAFSWFCVSFTIEISCSGQEQESLLFYLFLLY